MTKPESHLSAADAEFLREHSGVRPASPAELAELAARSAARDAYELRHSLMLPAVAAVLGVSEREVLGMTTAGELVGVQLAGDGRWANWQFSTGRPLPHLDEVVAAIPAGTHPVTLRAFMTTPDAVFLGLAEPLSPRDWLLSGGNPGRVVEFARVLGEQI